MQPRIRIGLIVGAIGLVLNICVSAFIGLCGPGFSLIAGAVAGFFAAQKERLGVKAEGAKAGATSGAVAGGLIIIGQLIGGIVALFLLQSTGAQAPFGQIPSVSEGASSQLVFYLSGAGASLCFGIIGALLAAGAGAATGYFGTSDQPAPPPVNTIN
jgi:hypothetical protein